MKKVNCESFDIEFSKDDKVGDLISVLLKYEPKYVCFQRIDGDSLIYRFIKK